MEQIGQLFQEMPAFVLDMFWEFAGDGFQLLLFFQALLYLLLSRQETRLRRFVGSYSLLCLFVLGFPITAHLIYRCIDTTYWRTLWLLPIPFVIAYVATRVCERVEGRLRKGLAVAICLLLILASGTGVWNRVSYALPSNYVKLSDTALSVCGAIEAVAEEKGLTYKKAAMVAELLPFIREYDASILMPYGRNAIKGEKLGDTEQALYDCLLEEEKDWAQIDALLRELDCNLLVYYIDECARAVLEGMGYELACIALGYYVYLVPEEAYEEEWTPASSLAEGEYLIRQYASTTGNQSTFYTIQDAQGHLIVIDGGWEADEDYVREVIESLGGVVDLWILTHAHADHAGAFCRIYEDPGELTIYEVLTVSLTYEVAMEQALWWEEYETLEQLTALLSGAENVSYASSGDVLEWYGLTIAVYSAYWDGIGAYTSDLINDGALLFKVTAQTESMLFCSDVGEAMSEKLIADYGEELAADYVQMGHHGNGGLSEAFYRLVAPRAAYFDAPRWLMENLNPSDGTEASYTTPEKQALMRELGAEIYSFVTASNEIILR